MIDTWYGVKGRWVANRVDHWWEFLEIQHSVTMDVLDIHILLMEVSNIHFNLLGEGEWGYAMFFIEVGGMYVGNE